jgi:energy-coupling factor transporter ATP-binding protein EcfA2
MENGLVAAVEAQLERAQLPSTTAALVRAAFAGERAIVDLLAHGSIEEPPPITPPSLPVGAYITAVEVEGFRGIGERATLELAPGPGLTLVIGRNGSGKSSFAEALEVLFTGDNPRWAKRSAVWREGWRNLHHPVTEIVATLSVEGVPGGTVVRRSWFKDAALESSGVEVQPHGLPKDDLSFLGWDEALPMYRPFLSYSELGSMLDEGPTRLHDAVASVLGLDELTAAKKALRDARLSREKAVKEVLSVRDQLVSKVEGLDDDRARSCSAALRGTPALDDVERLVTAGAPTTSQGELGLLHRLVGLDLPDSEVVSGAAAELRAAQQAVLELKGTETDAMLQSADLLEQALAYIEHYPTTDCPVCSTPGALGGDWPARARAQADEQRQLANLAQRERRRLATAVRSAHDLIGSVPQAIREARSLLDTAPVIAAWGPWVELLDEGDPVRLAGGIESAIGPLLEAMTELRRVAQHEIDRREDAWRPVASTIAAWIASARPALANAARLDDLKKAESWLKKAAVEIRNDRFAPIAEEAMQIWSLLRQRSNVQLGRIELKGTGPARKVTLDITVDGVAGAALGVMSQGELHALALSLFFPRATLDESPFRFVVVDDPVQSMDPAKVDGLARVLESASVTRQVIVFTHDDRLPEAVRRLGIEASILEVSRREGSIVELRPALTPIERHIADARAILRTDDLPESVARQVVPGFCRLALEAACIESVRRRRLGRGDAHADVESALRSVSRLGQFAAMALFDDAAKAGEVAGRIEREHGSGKVRAFQAANRGAHEGYGGNLEDLVRDSAVLAREFATA